MNTDTFTFIQVSEKAEEVLILGRNHHWRFRVIPEFFGTIDMPVFNSKGDWVYIPKRDEDEAIIPKAAYRRHHAIENAGYKVAQVVIGHEVKVSPEREAKPEIQIPAAKPIVPAEPKREIDWQNVAEVAAKGLLIGLMGVAVISFYALVGALQFVDPSYIVVLDDGTWVELITWDTGA